MISPDKRSIYIYEEVKGPEKDKLLIRRLSPDDRQPARVIVRHSIATISPRESTSPYSTATAQ